MWRSYRCISEVQHDMVFSNTCISRRCPVSHSWSKKNRIRISTRSYFRHVHRNLYVPHGLDLYRRVASVSSSKRKKDSSQIVGNLELHMNVNSLCTHARLLKPNTFKPDCFINQTISGQQTPARWMYFRPINRNPLLTVHVSDSRPVQLEQSHLYMQTLKS